MVLPQTPGCAAMLGLTLAGEPSWRTPLGRGEARTFTPGQRPHRSTGAPGRRRAKETDGISRVPRPGGEEGEEGEELTRTAHAPPSSSCRLPEHPPKAFRIQRLR